MQRLLIELNLPNQLTLLRVLLTPLFVFLFLSDSSSNKQLSVLVFVIAALTDWYDGWIARKWGYISRWGKFLDPLADKILSSAALLSYVYLNLVDGWMVWIIIFRDFLITGLRSYAEYKDQPIITSRGAQAKTFGQFVVIYYILFLYVVQSTPFIHVKFGETIDMLMDPLVLFGMMLLVTITTVATGAAYLFDNRKILTELFHGSKDQI